MIPLLVFTIGAGLIAFLLALAVLITDAPNKRWSTATSTGTAEFIVAGTTVIDCIVNDPDRYWDPKAKKIVYLGKIDESLPKEKKEELERERRRLRFGNMSFIERWLFDLAGIYLVSLIYPLRQLHKFNVVRKKLDLSLQRDENPDVNRLVTNEGDLPTTELKLEVPRSFAFKGIAVGDGGKIDVVITIRIFAVDPVQIVFRIGKDFFQPMEEILRSAFATLINEEDTFTPIQKDAKGNWLKDGDGNWLLEPNWVMKDEETGKLRSPRTEDFETLPTKPGSRFDELMVNYVRSQILDRTGWEVKTVSVSFWTEGESARDLREEREKVTRASLRAQQILKIAEARKEASKKHAQGIKEMATELGNDIAITYLETEAKRKMARAVEKTNLTALTVDSDGGGGAFVNVPPRPAQPINPPVDPNQQGT